VKALQAYIDTVRAVREPPLPTTLHSTLIISEQFPKPLVPINGQEWLSVAGMVLVYRLLHPVGFVRHHFFSSVDLSFTFVGVNNKLWKR
ncbi:hypothetical protein AALM74_26750, partial [Parabacteroides segnis]